MKSEITNKSVPSQVILGLGVIGLGVLFLLDNLGLIEFRVYWPVLVVVLGVVKLIDAKSPHERITYGLIAVIGVLLTLNRLGLSFLNMRTFWPLLLIAAGVVVIYKAVRGRSTIGAAMKADEDNDTVVDIAAILGGFERRLSTQTFRGGEVTAIMGGCDLDLRGSSIEQGDAVLNVYAVMGGITIKCPPDWTVVLQGTPIMGGFDEKTVTPPNNAKRLIVKGYAIMGGVEVRN